jgi:hypothetical protein
MTLPLSCGIVAPERLADLGSGANLRLGEPQQPNLVISQKLRADFLRGIIPCLCQERTASHV